MRAVAAALACALLCGCTYQVRHAGDGGFLHAPARWEPGRTSVRDVVQELGAPDVIRWSLGPPSIELSGRWPTL